MSNSGISFYRSNWGRALREAANVEEDAGKKAALVKECGWLLNTNTTLAQVRKFAEARITELNGLLITDHNHIELAENDRVLQHIDDSALGIAVSLWEMHTHELQQHDYFLFMLQYVEDK